ncbi:HpcH/HpaI aldolase/citrate lyase family protein [Microvirga guangxiensis]|uniref:Citrate lyase subunit beta / citryl-CoA lyase n=1 Tax=Microvirga guangxiensis TaxID=549386 RepID=A0A1G5DTL1_9HYPH|nr:CoA ester lyase [Microvirga guangxiensis]SCY17840.1 citrate lyase subunit beta / citryl-CoA lyase [Microvirga guangxiensis]
MIAIRPRRSALYMPASNARAVEKAKTLPADVVIFDLEDAVAPEMKEQARGAVGAAVKAGGYGSRELVIRINGLNTPWAEADLAAAADAAPDAILLPKVSSPDELLEAGRRLHSLGAPEKTRVWAMIETPLAILQAQAIAAVAQDQTSRLACLVMGTNDLAKDTRARLNPGRATMMPWLMTALAAARAYGIDILDGVYNDLSDEAGFRGECIEGRDCGFDGKTLIHPGQIAMANEVFAPSAHEVENARAIVDLFEQPENAGKGAISHKGRMVERLHADMAKRTLALADAIAQRR